MEIHLPPKLVATLTATADCIDSEGQLPPAARKNLFECFENLSVLEHAKAGYLRRARLGLLCASRVMGRLDHFPDLQEKSVQIWTHSLDALSGLYQLSALESDCCAFHTDVTNLFEFGDTAFPAAYGAMATLAAANIVLYDIDWDTVGDDEMDVSPDDWTPWFFASISESGSAAWEEKGGALERQIFWTWFVDAAAPLAWEVTTPLELSR